MQGRCGAAAGGLSRGGAPVEEGAPSDLGEAGEEAAAADVGRVAGGDGEVARFVGALRPPVAAAAGRADALNGGAHRVRTIHSMTTNGGMVGTAAGAAAPALPERPCVGAPERPRRV